MHSFKFSTQNDCEKKEVILPTMFCLLALLQVLDWHSTFHAMSEGRAETNGLILFVARFIGLAIAVSAFKIVAIGATFLYYKFGRNAARRVYVLCPLIILLLVYSVVVLKNYSN